MLSKALRVAGILSLGGLMTAAAFMCGSISSSGRNGGLSASLGPRPAFALSGASSASMANVAERVVGSVVNISSDRVVELSQNEGMPQGMQNDPFLRHFFFGNGPMNMPEKRHEKGLGSGVIIDSNGTVLTNNHVIDGAKDIHVTLSDGRELTAEVIGTDPQSDLGVLKLHGDIKGIRPLQFGDSDALRLGDVVLAVGDPFGVGETVTMGIVSAKGRANVGIEDYEDFIQTDAAINPGNSGGALVDSEGQLVGINTAILSRSGGYQGIGFAIPSKMAHSIVDSLLENGKVVRGWLGVVIQNVNQELADAMGLKNTQGVLISDVLSDGPAGAAGIQRGDVVTAVNGEKVDSVGQLRNVIATAGANKKVELSIIRDGKAKTLKVELAEKPDNVDEHMTSGNNSSTEQLMGLTLGNINRNTRDQFNLSSDAHKGAVVLSVNDDSRAAQAGFRPGDIILRVGHANIANASDAEHALRGKKKNLAILIQRGANTLYLALPAKERD